MFFIDDNGKTRRTNVNRTDSLNENIKVNKPKGWLQTHKYIYWVILLSIATLSSIPFVISLIEKNVYLKNHTHEYIDGECKICHELEVYTIEFVDENGETQVIEYTKNDEEIEVKAPEQRPGYNAAWESYNLDGKNSKVTVKYTPISYTIDYVIPENVNCENSEDNKTSYTIEDEDFVLFPLEKEGYMFTGWYQDAELTNRVSIIRSETCSNITLYAGFKKNITTVIFAPNGARETSQNFSLEAESSIALKNNYFTKIGNTFIGWSRTNSLDDLISEDEVYTAGLNTETVTFFAMWQQNSTVITYKSLVDDIEDKVQTIDFNSSAIVLNTEFKKYAHTLIGFSLTEGGEVEYSLNSEIRTGEDQTYITLYAVYERNKNIIVFDKGDQNASGEMESVTVDSVIDYNLPDVKFSLEDSYFVGWTTKKGDTTIEYSNSDVFKTSENNETVTLYAIWTKYNTVTLKFDANGGTAFEVITIKVSINETVDLPQEGYTYPGKTFSHWATSPTLENAKKYAKTYTYDSTSFISGGVITLYAIYDLNKTYITFDSNGGEGELVKQEIEAGDMVALLKNTYTKEGYTFVGWTRIKDSAGVDYRDEAKIKASLNVDVVTLYASWARNSTIINFDKGKGTLGFGKDDLTPIKVESLEKMTLPECPYEIVSYHFVGWSLEEDSEIVYIDKGLFTAPAQNQTITLYANYEYNYNMLVFNANNGTEDKKTQKVYTNSTKDTLTQNEFTYLNYTFKGWSLDKDSSVVTYNDGQVYNPTLNLETINLYAVWERNTTILSFYFEEVDDAHQMESASFLAGDKYNIPTNLYTKDGYRFIGWSKVLGGEVEYLENAEVTASNINDKFTLFPVFERNRTILVFNSNGATGSIDNIIVLSNETTTLPLSTFSYPGHTFVGWGETNDKVSYDEGEIFTAPKENFDEYVLYAIFENNLKTLNLYYNDGTNNKEVIDEFNISSGDIIEFVPVNSKNEDLEFLGWSTDSSSSTAMYKSNEFIMLGKLNNYSLYAIWAEKEGTNGIIYNLSSDSKYYIVVGYKGIKTSVEIPPTLKEIPVKEIAKEAFINNNTITDIIIGAQVRTIYEGAFKGCASLVNVTFKEGLETIKESAFENCTSIRKIVLPSTLVNVEKAIFKGLTALESVTLSANLTYISDSMFYGCDKLKSIELGDKVTEIKDKAFYSCTSLNTLKMNDSLEKIMNYAFYSCTSLENLTLSSNITYIGGYAFGLCSSLKEFNTPSKLETIDIYAFKGTGIKEITIPSTVTSIKEGAFSESSLENIIINSNITSISKNLFKDSLKLETVTITNSNTVKNIYQSAFSGCIKLTKVTGLEGVENIYDNAFYNASSLNDISLLHSVKRIKNNAFSGAAKLSSIFIPKTIEIVSASAFTNSGLYIVYYDDYERTNLDTLIADNKVSFGSDYEIVIKKPDDESLVDPYTMYWYLNDSGIPTTTKYKITLRLHGGIVTYGMHDGVVKESTASYDVEVPGIQEIKNYLSFKDNDNTTYKFELKQYKFIGWSFTENGSPDILRDATEYEFGIETRYFDLYAVYEKKVLINGEYIEASNILTFEEFTNSTTGEAEYKITGIKDLSYFQNPITLVLPEYYNGHLVTVIGESAFKGRGTLEYVIIPASIKEIESEAFANTGLKELSITQKIIIGNSAFYNCGNLEKVSINTEAINEGVFEQCSKLVDVSFGDITSIKANAFKNCEALENITLPSSLTEILDSAFSNTSLKNLILPLNLVTIGNYTFSEIDTLVSLTLNDKIERIGDQAFAFANIKNIITLPKSLLYIGSEIFRGNATPLRIRLNTNIYDNNKISTTCLSKVDIEYIIVSEEVDNLTNFFKDANPAIYYEGEELNIFAQDLFSEILLYSAFKPAETLENNNRYWKYNGKLEPEVYILKTITVNYHNGSDIIVKKYHTFDKYIELEKASSLGISNGNLTLVGYSDSESSDEIKYQLKDILTIDSDKTFDLYTIWANTNTDSFTFEFVFNMPSTKSTYTLVEYTWNATPSADIIIPDYVYNSSMEMYFKVTQIKKDHTNFAQVNSAYKLYLNKFITEIPKNFMGNCTFDEVVFTSAQKTIRREAFTYSTITKFINLKDVEVIETYGFFRVTIGSGANLDLSSVTTINTDSFYELTGVFESGKFNFTSLAKIGNTQSSYGMLYDKFKTVSFADDVTYIHEYAFRDFGNLVSVTLNDNTEVINCYAFDYCDNLETVDLGNGIKKICAYAFYGCTKLTTVNNLKYVEEMEEYAFYQSGITSIDLVNIKIIGNYAFCGCESLVDVNLHNVERIGDRAFYNCYSIDKITIPKSCTYLGDYSFYNCYGLTSITLLNTSDACMTHVLSWGYKQQTVFMIGDPSKNQLSQVYVQEEFGFIDVTMFSNRGSQNIYVLNDLDDFSKINVSSEKKIENDVIYYHVTEAPKPFHACWTGNVGNPQIVTKTVIVNYKIIYEDNIEPDQSTVPLYGVEASYDYVVNLSLDAYESLSEDYIIGWTTVPNGKIIEYKNGDTITIDENIEELNLYAIFLGYKKYKDIYTFKYNDTYVKKYMEISDASNNTNSEMVIPNYWYNGSDPHNVYPVKDVTAKGLTQFESVTFNDFITVIPYRMFENSTNLKYVYNTDNIIEVKYNAFNGCEYLTGISLPNVEEVGSYAFNNAGSKANITNFLVLDKCSYICYYAFYGCSFVKELYFDYSASRIEGSAFNGANNLEKVVFSGKNENYKYEFKLNYNIFGNNSSLKYFELNSEYLTSLVKSEDSDSFITNAPNLETLIINCPKLKSLAGLNIDNIGTASNKELKVYIMQENLYNDNVFLSGKANNALRDGTFSYYKYSEEEPTGIGNCWHYVDGVPTPYPTKYIVNYYESAVGLYYQTGEKTYHKNPSYSQKLQTKDFVLWDLSTSNNSVLYSIDELFLELNSTNTYKTKAYSKGAILNIDDIIEQMMDRNDNRWEFRYTETLIMECINGVDGIPTVSLFMIDDSEYNYYVNEVFIFNEDEAANGIAYISGYNTGVTIPDKFKKDFILPKKYYSTINAKWLNVIGISELAFEGMSYFDKITIPENYTMVRSNALNGVVAKEIVINSIETVLWSNASSYYALGNSKIDKVTIYGNTLTKLANSMLMKSSVKEIELHTPILNEINDSIFTDCSNLTKINIPDSVTIIGDYAFNRCTSLVELKLPGNLTYIGEDCFYYSSNLKFSDITYINTDSYLTISNYAFYNTGIKEIVFTGNIDFFSRAFSNNNSLVKVTFGAGVKEIKYDNVFEKCSYLEEIVFGDDFTSFTTDCFFQSTYISKLTFGDSFVDIPNTFSNCHRISSITFGKNVKTIAENAFKDCNVSELHFNEGLETIGEYAFDSCIKLTDVVLPSSLKTIGKYAFFGDIYLINIELNEGLKTIGEYAFYGCREITEITIPSTLTSLGDSAFQNCSSLTTLTFKDGLTTIPDLAFRNCENLTNLTLSNTISVIGTEAFYACDGFDEITFPSSIREIKKSAFEFIHFDKINLNEGLVSIGDSAFASSSLDLLILPSTLESLGVSAFNTVTSIHFKCAMDKLGGNHNFDSVSELLNLYLESNTSKIDKNVLKMCVRIKNVYINADSVSNDLFDENIEYKYIYFRDTTEELTSARYVFEKGTILESKFYGLYQLDDKYNSYIIPACTKYTYQYINDSDTTVIKEYVQFLILDIENMTPTCNSMFNTELTNEYGTLFVTNGYCGDLVLAENQKVIANKIDSKTMKVDKYSATDNANFTYLTVIDNNETYLVIDSCSLPIDTANIVFPTYQNDGKGNILKIIGITSNALTGRGEYLEEVTMPKFTRYIYKDTFKGFSLLTTVNNLDYVVEIRESAFESCTNLVMTSLSNTVKIIGNSAFKNCSKVGLINILPISLEKLGDYALYNTSSEINDLPTTLTYIGDYALSGTIGNHGFYHNYISEGTYIGAGNNTMCYYKNPIVVSSGVRNVVLDINDRFTKINNYDKAIVESSTLDQNSFANTSINMFTISAKNLSGQENIVSSCNIQYLVIDSNVEEINIDKYFNNVNIGIILVMNVDTNVVYSGSNIIYYSDTFPKDNNHIYFTYDPAKEVSEYTLW